MRPSHYVTLLLGTLATWPLSYLDLPVSPRHHLPEPTPQAPQPPRDELPPLVPRPVVFWGTELPGSKVAYVLDYSSSMTPLRWARLQEEVARSLRSLPPGTTWRLMLYGCSVEEFSDEWSSAGDVATGLAWLASVPKPWNTHNATGTAQAVLYALASGADLLCLCTDGMPGGCGLEVKGEVPYLTHARVIREANTRPIPVIAVSLQADEYGQRFCSQVASDSGGIYVRAS